MKVGIDGFSLHPLALDAFGQLKWVAEHSFDGIQFGVLDDDAGRNREVRAEADRLGLYSHVSVSSPNRHLGDGDAAARVERISRQVEQAAACGWHELHTTLGGPDTRYAHEVPWPRQLADAFTLVNDLAPVLRNYGSRLNFETHGEITTFEIVRLIEQTGPDIAGCCLDTANVLVFAEDPVAAARRVAPYTHLTHSKDGIVYFCETGIERQGRPPGEGVVDWRTILPILAEHAPDLPLSIEDHKWQFRVDIFTPVWHAANPDLSREELCRFVEIAWGVQQRIDRGELPRPVAYEAVPYADEMEARLLRGQAHLKGLLADLGLRS